MPVEIAPDGVPQPGDLIAAKYVVERVLGVGGMGVVVAARHVDLRRPVAIKFMLGSQRPTAESVARFSREARTAGGLRSEHVVRVQDVGTTERGEPFMVMELLEGRDLGALLAERGPLQVRDAVDYVVQACDAIAEAHASGIVHRDLKPSNLFLTIRSDGSSCVKVLDFGISKATRAGEPDASLTNSAAVMGSPLYMSPEQVRSAKNVDGRTDVWALGVILYELLTGNPPFRGETFSAICVAIATDTPPPMGLWRPDVPPELESIVSHCLQKDPGQRMPNVGRLAQSLTRFCSPQMRHLADRIARAPTEPVHAPVAASPTAPASAWGRTHKSARTRRTALLGLAGGAAAAALVGSLVFSARGRSASPEVQSASPATALAPSASVPATVPSASNPASSQPPTRDPSAPSGIATAPPIVPRRPSRGAGAPTAAPSGGASRGPVPAAAPSSAASDVDPASALEGRK